MKLFHASRLKVPTPSTKAGTPRIEATVSLSSFTKSASARSLSVSGLTCSTENCSAGISHGSPASLPSTYSLSSFFRPAFPLNSSLSASTLTMIDGFHLELMKPFSVAVACLRLLATSISATR